MHATTVQMIQKHFKDFGHEAKDKDQSHILTKLLLLLFYHTFK